MACVGGKVSSSDACQSGNYAMLEAVRIISLKEYLLVLRYRSNLAIVCDLRNDISQYNQLDS